MVSARPLAPRRSHPRCLVKSAHAAATRSVERPHRVAAHAATFERGAGERSWTTAWFHLSGRSKLQIGGVEEFLEWRSPVIPQVDRRSKSIRQFMTPELDSVPADMRSDLSQADVSRGHVVRVHHPRAQRASSATVQLYVAPLRSGDEWRIWILSN